MKRLPLFSTTNFLIIVFSSARLALTAQTAHISVDAAKVLNRIPEHLVGSCIEDVNHEVYGGVYAQRIFGESFEEPAPAIAYKGWLRLPAEWRIGGGGIPEAAAPGFKLVYEDRSFDNGVVEADVIFSDRGRNAGLLFRVSNAHAGSADFDGYRLQVGRHDKRLELQKCHRYCEVLASAELSKNPQDTMHLKAEMKGDRLSVYIDNASKPCIDFTDKQPLAAGRVGIFANNAAARLENIKFTADGAAAMPLSLTPAPIPQVSFQWEPVFASAAVFSIDSTHAFTGKQSQCISLNGNGKAGIANAGLNHWGIAISKGETMTGSICLQGDQMTMPVILALENAAGDKTYASTPINNVGAAWKKYTFTLKPSQTDGHARFVVYANGRGKLWVDQVLLLPGSLFHGLPFRKDIVTAMQQEGLQFLRYGGTMVNSPEYRWKNMTGPVDQRPPYKGHWYPYGSNGFGIEAFLQLCESAGFVPAFAINVEESPADIGDMVEYLTGSSSTNGGKRRAAAGHPKPYAVPYIEIGNEEVIWGNKAEDYQHYIDRFLLLHDAIHAKNPTIKLVCSAWWRPNAADNMALVFKALDGKADYWDLHTDADDPDAGVTVDRNLTKMESLFRQWNPQTTMRIAVFEENGGLHNQQRALGHASTLNAIRKHGDFVLTSCAANALQPYQQNDNDWDQGQIFFMPDSVWGMPPFYASQMASAHWQPLRVADSADDRLSVSATIAKDGRRLVMHVVNPGGISLPTEINIDRFDGMKSSVSVETLSGALSQEIAPGDDAGKGHPVRSTLTAGMKVINYDFPAYSYTVLTFGSFKTFSDPVNHLPDRVTVRRKRCLISIKQQ